MRVPRHEAITIFSSSQATRRFPVKKTSRKPMPCCVRLTESLMPRGASISVAKTFEGNGRRTFHCKLESCIPWRLREHWFPWYRPICAVGEKYLTREWQFSPAPKLAIFARPDVVKIAWPNKATKKWIMLIKSCGKVRGNCPLCILTSYQHNTHRPTCHWHSYTQSEKHLWAISLI